MGQQAPHPHERAPAAAWGLDAASAQTGSMYACKLWREGRALRRYCKENTDNNRGELAVVFLGQGQRRALVR
jgi:hypothetical protein